MAGGDGGRRTIAPTTPQTLINLSEQTHEYSSVHLHSSWQRETHLPLKSEQRGACRGLPSLTLTPIMAPSQRLPLHWKNCFLACKKPKKVARGHEGWVCSQ